MTIECSRCGGNHIRSECPTLAARETPLTNGFPQSHETIRNLIAREIWRYQECPWDFDNPDSMMGDLQKQIAIDQAEGIRKVIMESAVLKAALRSSQNGERRCPKCGILTNGEEAWINEQIWCHPCADALSQNGERERVIEECAQWHEDQSRIAMNSLHCGDNATTIQMTRIRAEWHDNAAAAIRALKSGEKGS